jgi:hypothetical protein
MTPATNNLATLPAFKRPAMMWWQQFPFMPDFLMGDLIKRERSRKQLQALTSGGVKPGTGAIKAAGMEKSAVIKKENGEYVLYTADGSRVLGRHPTRRKAIDQEYAIQKSSERNMKKHANVDLSALLQMLPGARRKKKSKKPTTRRDYIAPALLAAGGIGTIHLADKAIPSQTSKSFKSFSEAMLQPYREAGFTDKISDEQAGELARTISNEQAANFATNYALSASEALSNPIFVNRKPSDLVLHARRRAPDLHKTFKDSKWAKRPGGKYVEDLLAGAAKYPVTDEASARHYRDIGMGPLPAYAWQLGEYPALGYHDYEGRRYVNNGFEKLVQNRWERAGMPPAPSGFDVNDTEAASASGGLTLDMQHRLLQRLREKVNEQFPPVNNMPAEFSSLPKDQQVDIVRKFPEWLKSKGYEEDAAVEQALSAALGEYRLQGAAKEYAEYADKASKLRSGLMVGGGVATAAGLLWLAHNIRKRRNEKKEKVQTLMRRNPSAYRYATQAGILSTNPLLA